MAHTAFILEQGNGMASVEEVKEVEQRIYREARILDDEHYEDWFDMMTEDIHYFMPGIETRYRKDKTDQLNDTSRMAYYNDNKEEIKKRLARLDTGTAWSEDHLNVPVIDHWWQTETSWSIAANCMGIEVFPVKPGSSTKAVPGYDVQVLDTDGNNLPAGEMGNIVVKLPLPPGCMTTLWESDERFFQTYLAVYEGYYLTGDAGYIDDDGYIYIMSRIDDVINVAGHRLSTGGMEEVLASHKDVAECAVTGVADSLKGQLPLGLVVLAAGVDRPHEDIIDELIQLVRDKIGPVASFKLATVVNRLPKTRSGKILRSTMSKIADGEDYKVPATIDDPVILNEITESLLALGYPPK